MDEEAHFYWTLSQFEELIIRHGSSFVLSKLKPEFKERIIVWSKKEEEKKRKPCALCT